MKAYFRSAFWRAWRRAGNFPHPRNPYPKSFELVSEVLADVGPEERQMMAGRNAAQLYRIPVDDILV